MNKNPLDIQLKLGAWHALGRDMFLTGAITTHGGNLSERDGDTILISRRDSMLGNLRDGDIIETGIEPSPTDGRCSRELVVHRAMYAAYPEQIAAIVHAHTPNTIARSLTSELIVPLDSEGKFAFAEGVPVLSPSETIGSTEAAQMLAKCIEAGTDIGVIRGHGPFAIAENLERALRLVSILEMSCHILNLHDATHQDMA